jgi:diaminopimelate epimerase
MEDKDVKIKMSVCPECGNAIRVAVEHTMDRKSKNEFAQEVMQFDLQVKTISLEDYRSSNVQLYCRYNCQRKTTSPTATMLGDDSK